ncbi:His-Xaa-Ser system radical SAM maturase HxsB [Methylophilaceae bacterium]|nr:His-Xaa-Ser system radical SAM maturase HxsB [Methylophilaceae bacterium]
MSKFKEVSFYAPPKKYKLLPFRFDKFNEDQSIITNLVGEYMLFPTKDLDNLINLKYKESSEHYGQLRSKHFIYQHNEKSPIELVALKLRTKFSRLPSFTSLHIFVVTLRCDHSCPYCQVSRQSQDKNKFDMSYESADRSIDFVFRSPSKAIKIEFQGGEPLLNFDLVKYIVIKAKKINLERKADLQFVIATTMSLITEEIISFCKEHRIVISSSLDGPADLHNKNRPRRDKNSYEKFVEGLTKTRDALGYDQVSALMTTTEDSLKDVRGIIDEYLMLGFNGIFLRPLSPYGFAIKTKKFLSYQAERWFDFYKAGLDYIIELNRSGIDFSEQYSSIILSKILTSNDPGYVDLMNPSGIGIAAIVFNYDGDVYASDESRMLAEMGDKKFNLGNVNSNTYEEIILSDNLLDVLEESFTLSMPMCNDCAYENYCGSDPVYHYATQKDVIGRKPESDFCKRNISIFKHLISLMESDQFIKELFTRWANRC